MATSSQPEEVRSLRARAEPAGDHAWTFLSNYAHVLVSIAKDPDATLREIADLVGVTERAVHRIVSELEASGAIERSKEGRRNHYEIALDAPMRHTLEEDKTIGDLLNALLTKSEARALRQRTRPNR